MSTQALFLLLLKEDGRLFDKEKRKFHVTYTAIAILNCHYSSPKLKGKKKNCYFIRILFFNLLLINENKHKF